MRILSEKGTPLRGVMRNSAKTTALNGTVWVQADLADRKLLEPALSGTERLFLLTANKTGFGKAQIEVIQAAQELGVKHVVKLSALGREVSYRSLSMDEMRKRLESQGMAGNMIDSLLALAAYQKAGGPTERVSPSVSEILGRAALSTRDFVRHHTAAFVQAEGAR